MNHLQRINTVFVYVRDLKAARDFYEQVLGFGPPALNTKFWVEYELPGGGTHFALHLKDADYFQGQNGEKPSMKCSIEVQDIKAYAASLKSRGVQFSIDPRKEYGFWLAEFADRDGNRLRLYEKVKK
jgi:catechol 2,3-dioxygenase-like lactoylglutathione lyase family enzyme